MVPEGRAGTNVLGIQIHPKEQLFPDLGILEQHWGLQAKTGQSLEILPWVGVGLEDFQDYVKGATFGFLPSCASHLHLWLNNALL